MAKVPVIDASGSGRCIDGHQLRLIEDFRGSDRGRGESVLGRVSELLALRAPPPTPYRVPHAALGRVRFCRRFRWRGQGARSLGRVDLQTHRGRHPRKSYCDRPGRVETVQPNVWCVGLSLDHYRVRESTWSSDRVDLRPAAKLQIGPGRRPHRVLGKKRRARGRVTLGRRRPGMPKGEVRDPRSCSTRMRVASCPMPVTVACWAEARQRSTRADRPARQTFRRYLRVPGRSRPGSGMARGHSGSCRSRRRLRRLRASPVRPVPEGRGACCGTRWSPAAAISG